VIGVIGVIAVTDLVVSLAVMVRSSRSMSAVEVRGRGSYRVS